MNTIFLSVEAHATAILSIPTISSITYLPFIFKLLSLEIGRWQHIFDLVGTN